MMLSVILLCILLSLYGFWSWKVYLIRGHKLPPLFTGVLPIIGHLHLIVGDGSKLWLFIKNISAEAKKQGGVVCFLFGSKIYYFITDPEDALTAANACLQKHFIYDYGKPWLGDGLITASGEVWKRHRKLLTPAFSLPVMYGFLDIFNIQARKFVDILKHEVGKPFDHTIYFRNIALETFCLTAFGIDGFEDKDFIKSYMNATDKILAILTSRFQNVWLQSELMFKLCGLKKKHDELIQIVNAMSNKIIQKKKETRNMNRGQNVSKIIGRYKPFLDLLLELSDDNVLTDKEIREEVDTAIIAGYDTTSSLLSYIMILLGTHPLVQERLYNEIEEVVERSRDVEKDDLQQLVYMEAVIKESLRIFTTGPLTLRYVDKDVKLKNYTMRAGSQCVLLLYGIHRDHIWGKDGDQFRPERWLNPDNPVTQSAFVGFSLGKRSCLGKTYAMITMKISLVHILRHYKIYADDSELRLRIDFLLKPVSGHEICLEKRISIYS